jgi:hypothetical protein
MYTYRVEYLDDRVREIKAEAFSPTDKDYEFYVFHPESGFQQTIAAIPRHLVAIIERIDA